MLNTFCNCSSLKYLDISNFDTSRLYYYQSIFTNCDKIEYMNLLNYKGRDIFNSFPNYNFTICINDYSKIKTQNSEENSLIKNNVENKCIETKTDEIIVNLTTIVEITIPASSQIIIAPNYTNYTLPDAEIYLLGFDKFKHDAKNKIGHLIFMLLKLNQN